MVLIRKNKSSVLYLNQIWIRKTLVKTLTCILIEQLISNCIIFETNKYIYRNGFSVAVDCKSMVKVTEDKGKPKFL